MDARDELRAKLLKKAKDQINQKLAGKEIHLIKAVNLLSDLESITNLLGENANEWEKRQPKGEAEKEFAQLKTNSEKILEEKKSLIEFIEKEMIEEFPNFSVLATPTLGAKLLASAGSKKRLCFMPASTIQLLGAEKALFAHMRHKAKSPKHGHIFNHPLMQKLPRTKRGKAARTIAGKLSIALKIDYFKGENNSKQMLEELSTEIKKIEEEPLTEKDERKEKEYELRQEKNKQEYNKSQADHYSQQRRTPKTESKTFTPEERRAYFEKMGMRKREQKEETPRQEHPKRQINFNKKPWQKNSKYEHTSKNWRDKPQIEENFGERPQREKKFGEQRNFGEEKREFTPRRERNFNYKQTTRERFPGQKESWNRKPWQKNFNRNDSQNTEKSWQKHPFQKPQNTKQYAKTRFRNKFGKQKYVKR